MEILNSTIEDIEQIFDLYRSAAAYMQTRFSVHWPEFDRQLVVTELLQGRQWKLVVGDAIACVWATTFDDPQIWEEANSDPAVYIHRIATAPDFRGQNLVANIVAWAREYASLNGKQYIRLDTVGENLKLIEHYTRNGFSYLGLRNLRNTDGLPQHYTGKPACLFEIDLR